jgi:hypothetical protein
MLSVDDPIDDRALLTTLLAGGKFTRPVPLHARRPHGFGIALLLEQRATVSTLVARLLAVVTELRVIYVRPHRSLPALPLELHRLVADDPQRLARVLEVVRFQCVRQTLRNRRACPKVATPPHPGILLDYMSSPAAGHEYRVRPACVEKTPEQKD